MSLPLIDRSPAAVPLHAVAAREWAGWLRRQPAATRTWLQASGTTGRAGQLSLVPKSDGKPALEIRPYRAAPQRDPLEVLRGSVLRFDDPLSPVGDDVWEAAQ